MHPAMDGSPALASVGQRSQEVAVYLDAALGPERAAIAMHINAWASLVETASAAQLAVVPLITANELARLCHSDRSPVVLVYDTRSTCLDVAVADLHAAGAERVITGPALVVAAHLLALARLLAHSRFREADNRLTQNGAHRSRDPVGTRAHVDPGRMPALIDASLHNGLRRELWRRPIHCPIYAVALRAFQRVRCGGADH